MCTGDWTYGDLIAQCRNLVHLSEFFGDNVISLIRWFIWCVDYHTVVVMLCVEFMLGEDSCASVVAAMAN